MSSSSSRMVGEPFYLIFNLYKNVMMKHILKKVLNVFLPIDQHLCDYFSDRIYKIMMFDR